MEAKSVKRIKDLQNQLDLKRKTELIAQEEKKNNFLATIIANHDKTFDEMKKYYTDITATNLKLITELKVIAEYSLYSENSVPSKFPELTILFLDRENLLNRRKGNTSWSRRWVLLCLAALALKARLLPCVRSWQTPSAPCSALRGTRRVILYVIPCTGNSV